MKKKANVSAAARIIRFFLWKILPGEKGKRGKGIFGRRNKSGIAEFCYRYDGTIGGNNYSYTVAQKDGGAVFICEVMEHPSDKSARGEVGAAVLERVNELYRTYRLYRWDGYSRYNSFICDGEGFSLSIKFRDGRSLHANGMNAFPVRYREFSKEMSALLDPIKEELLDKAESKPEAAE